MATGTWLVGTLTLVSGIAGLAATVRTWYWNRGHGNGLRTRATLFGLAIATSFAATVITFLQPQASWPVWTLAPAALAAAAALRGVLRDKDRREAAAGPLWRTF